MNQISTWLSSSIKKVEIKSPKIEFKNICLNASDGTDNIDETLTEYSTEAEDKNQVIKSDK